MAVPPDYKTFLPELWSEQILQEYRESLMAQMGWPSTPKRDKYSQMLRDKALGKPEFPEPKYRERTNNLTATQMRMMYEQEINRAAARMAANIDTDILRGVYERRERD